MVKKEASGWSLTRTWILCAVFTVVWLPVASQGSLQRFVAVVWASAAAFMVGALVGFLFSSYGEENTTLGKIRDWLIGGITALTVVKAQSLKNGLAIFAVGTSSLELAFVVGATVFYAGLGFFFMFFQRELVINVLLARGRAERDEVKGSKETGQIVRQLLLKLPPSLLTGARSIDDITELKDANIKELQASLNSDDVDTFLEQAEEMATNGALDWDTTSKAAYILYYRTYFEKNDQATVHKAIEWITRALTINPLHVDLTMKYAEMLWVNADYDAAIELLERLAARPEAPILVRQWLGYYLRSDASRADESIRHSTAYHQLVPDESDSLFNIAYAYFVKACAESDKDQSAESRSHGLAALREALDAQPDMRPTVSSKWVQEPELQCIAQDDVFRQLVGASTVSPTSGAPTVGGQANTTTTGTA